MAGMKTRRVRFWRANVRDVLRSSPVDRGIGCERDDIPYGKQQRYAVVERERKIEKNLLLFGPVDETGNAGRARTGDVYADAHNGRDNVLP